MRNTGRKQRSTVPRVLHAPRRCYQPLGTIKPDTPPAGGTGVVLNRAAKRAAAKQHSAADDGQR